MANTKILAAKKTKQGRPARPLARKPAARKLKPLVVRTQTGLEFELQTTKAQQRPTTGYYELYHVNRRDVATALRKNRTMNYVSVLYYWGNGKLNFMLAHFYLWDTGRLDVGCMRFSPPETRIIREWALKEQK